MDEEVANRIKEYWSKKADQKGLDLRATAFDINQKRLEVEDITNFLFSRNGEKTKILDIGCGTGYLACELAQVKNWEIVGVDYSEKIIEVCNRRREMLGGDARKQLKFECANALDLPLEDETFDVVLGERLLINLPSLEQKKKAVQEIWRVLKSDGFYLMFEGSEEGLQRLNKLRAKYGLYEIGNHWTQSKIEEQTFIPYLKHFFEVTRLKRYGMFYFISRIIHPLLVAPEEPEYDAKINDVARMIASTTPNYKGIGHLIFLTLKKRGR